MSDGNFYFRDRSGGLTPSRSKAKDQPSVSETSLSEMAEGMPTLGGIVEAYRDDAQLRRTARKQLNKVKSIVVQETTSVLITKAKQDAGLARMKVINDAADMEREMQAEFAEKQAIADREQTAATSRSLMQSVDQKQRLLADLEEARTASRDSAYDEISDWLRHETVVDMRAATDRASGIKESRRSRFDEAVGGFSTREDDR